MLLGTIFQSVEAWQKLSSISMKPKIAYAVLKYTKVIGDEHAIIEKQRVALLHDITDTKDREDVRVEPGTPEFKEYVKRLNEVMSQESTVEQIAIDLKDVVEALDEKDETLTVRDLAILEPFFSDYIADYEEPEEVN